MKNWKTKPSPFVPVTYTEPFELPDEEYPFTLTTGRRYESYNTHTQTRHYAAGKNKTNGRNRRYASR